MAPCDFFRFLSTPEGVRVVSWVFIALYYVFSWLFIYASKNNIQWRILARNGLLDWVTSIFWIFFAILLIGNLILLAATNSLDLGILAEFYVFFLFLFAFLYGLIEWHFPGKLKGINAAEYEAEVQYFILSVGVQTLVNRGRVETAHWVTELIASVQALLGLGFVAVWVATAVSRISG